MGSLPSGWELVLIVLVVVLLFGAKKLPESARGIGRSLRIFKAEIKGDGDDAPNATTMTTTTTQIAATPVVPPVVPTIAPGVPVPPPATTLAPPVTADPLVGRPIGETQPYER